MRRCFRIFLMTAVLLFLVGIGYTGTRHHIATRVEAIRLERQTRELVLEMLDRGFPSEDIAARIESMQNRLDQKGKTAAEIQRLIDTMRKEHEQ